MKSIWARGAEQRAVSYQDVWGRGDDWQEIVKGSSDPLALSTAFACIRLLSSIFGQLPFDAYRDRGGFSEKVGAPSRLIVKPSPNRPRSLWLAEHMVSQLVWGNSYGYVYARDAAGYPTGLQWLDASKIRVEQLDAGGNCRFWLNGEQLATADVVHIPFFVLPGVAKGVAPLERSGQVQLAMQVQKFAERWFKDGAVPGAILSYDGDLDAEQAKEVKRRFLQTVRAQAGVAVLGGKFSYERVGVPGNEAQFLETSQNIDLRVAHSFGVLPSMLGLLQKGASLTYANREQDVQNLLTTTLNLPIVVMQEVLTGLLPNPQFVRFNTAALLRSDLETRYRSYQTALAAGFLTVDEVRQLEDRQPLPEGQSNV